MESSTFTTLNQLLFAHLSSVCIFIPLTIGGGSEGIATGSVYMCFHACPQACLLSALSVWLDFFTQGGMNMWFGPRRWFESKTRLGFYDTMSTFALFSRCFGSHALRSSLFNQSSGRVAWWTSTRSVKGVRRVLLKRMSTSASTESTRLRICSARFLEIRKFRRNKHGDITSEYIFVQCLVFRMRFFDSIWLLYVKS